MGVLIDQEKNYSANFGGVYRSSAIFYKPKNISCTLSISNYWKFKNNFNVILLCSYRAMDGKLISRKEYSFQNSNVLNISIEEIDEGSIEVEAFSNINLRIPYAAVMALYETKNSVSMVHSYSRNHSLIELENNTSITEGRESCWTVRSSKSITNSAIFHNGHLEVKKQNAKLILTNIEGADKEVTFTIQKLSPFETIVFDLNEISPNFREHLLYKDGWATIHFNNHSSFTRMLITWFDKENLDYQVTHSNFDYSNHKTNFIKSKIPAYMKIPTFESNIPLTAVVYPKYSKGNYYLKLGGKNKYFDSGLFINLNEKEDKSIAFSREDGDLPSRLVTGIIGNTRSNKLPFECSISAFHQKRPSKRFHWLLVSKRLNSKIYVTDYRELYNDDINEKVIFSLSLYNPFNKNTYKKDVSFAKLDSVDKVLYPEKIFGTAFNDLKDELGYVGVFSNYSGFTLYSSIEKNTSVSLEHSF